MSIKNSTKEYSDHFHGLVEQCSDNSLLKQFRKGNEDAATQIFQRYVNRLNALARSRVRGDVSQRVDSEDIVQSVFRVFFHNARGGLYDVPKGEDLWRLFLVLTLNKIREKYHFHHALCRDSSQTISVDALDGYCVPDQTPDSSVELEMILQETMAELPDDLREIVKLRIEGFEIAEISTKTGSSKRTVERRLQGFRKKMLEILQVNEL